MTAVDPPTTTAPDVAATDTAEVIAAAVAAVAGVASLHPGRLGEIGTYLPGRRVAGVRLSDARIEIHVVVHDGAHLLDTATAVRAAAAAVLPGDGRPVDVVVADLAPRDDEPAAVQPGGSAATVADPSDARHPSHVDHAAREKD